MTKDNEEDAATAFSAKSWFKVVTFDLMITVGFLLLTLNRILKPILNRHT